MKYYSLLLTFLVFLSASTCQKTSSIESKVIDAPANVTVTYNKGGVLSLSWDAVPEAVLYVARLENSDGSLVTAGQKNVSVPQVSFSGLVDDRTYVFKVRANTGTAKSEYSEPLSIVAGTGSPEGPDNPDNPDNPDDPAEGYAAFRIPAAEDSDGMARAFPGAEGGGMYTTGGRGGRVIHVTTLADSGPGSLREAVKASGPRTIVFDVAGTIELLSDLEIKNGDLTIAGQTAPGDGICLRNYSTVIKCDNVIIRFLRFRLGDEGENADDGEDAVWGRYRERIIFDHCSMSWSIDECASFYANEYFTMQWCLISESLRKSIHGKGDHGYGGIWGGKNASFHHNMLANHLSRNPRFDHPEIYEDMTSPARRGNVDFRNNVIWNWGDNSTYGGEGAWFNMVGNYYKPGPASKDRKYFIDAYAIYSGSKNPGATVADNGKKVFDYGYPSLYMSGNVHARYSDISSDNGKGVYWHNGTQSSQSGKLLSAPLSLSGPDGKAVGVSTHDAVTAFDKVCEWAGASLARDAVDERACKDARSGTATITDGGNGSVGGLVDSPSKIGGWPEYKADASQLAAAKDSDGDGMGDAFEDLFGLDKDNAEDGALFGLDPKKRYTNLEMFLHYIVRDIVSAQNDGGSYVRM